LKSKAALVPRAANRDTDMDSSSSLSRPPTGGEMFRDRLFRGLTFSFAWLTILIVVAVIWQIAAAAAPAVQELGTDPITSTKWDGKENFGFLPEIWGTIYSSVLGVFIGAVFGVAIAIFLTQDFLPPKWEVALKNVIELLAAIPSVVYGLWGIFVVIPAIRPACNWLHEHLGWIPIFGTRLIGPGLLPAALVLAIMVLPTVTAISRDALASVPPRLREAAFGLGATRWETILAVVLPTASRGVWGSIILAFGRALGETMALAMLVGNASVIEWSMFGPANTLAALLANKFPEASQMEVGVLMYAALVLLAITLLVNVIGAWFVRDTAVKVA
jgi:phosphate transport system permease protein